MAKPGSEFKHSMVDTNGITMHAIEIGTGPAVLFVHGFPSGWITWRQQMEAVAKAGYRAIAVDMRGNGRTTIPEDPKANTFFHLIGDLVGLLKALDIPKASLVGHDFGGHIVFAAAMLRPDVFTSVFAISCPHLERGDYSFIDDAKARGLDSFYMLHQSSEEAVEAWSNAAVTYPSFLYWSSGSPSPEDRWNVFDKRPMQRPAPVAVPPWADPDDIAYIVGEFKRNGFRGGLNYYACFQTWWELTSPWRGAKIHTPSVFLVGETDGLNELQELGIWPTPEQLRELVPGLREKIVLAGVGHWPQQEAPKEVSDAIVSFLGGLTPIEGGRG
jgi:pimeloyl-ACP methyl ester carboxylesterase